MKRLVLHSLFLVCASVCLAQYLYFSGTWTVNPAFVLKQSLPVLCLAVAGLQLWAVRSQRSCAVCLLLGAYIFLICVIIGNLLFGASEAFGHLCAEVPSFCVASSYQCVSLADTGKYSSLLYLWLVVTTNCMIKMILRYLMILHYNFFSSLRILPHL